MGLINTACPPAICCLKSSSLFVKYAFSLNTLFSKSSLSAMSSSIRADCSQAA